MDFSRAPEQDAFIDAVRAFARDRVQPRAAGIDQTSEFPRDLVVEAAGLGIPGLTVSPVWGGAGRDYLTYALAIEAIGYASATLAVILTVTHSLVAEPLVAFGTEAQRGRWLRALVSGEAIGAFALSEEQAGSDAANQRTFARREGHGYRLAGRKVWVANGAAAHCAIVFAATDLEARGRGLTAFIVPLDASGITRHPCDSLGVRGLGCVDLEFDDVAVDDAAILGTAGHGFALARDALEGGRIAIAAQALGVGQAALDLALDYAREREAFGQPIGRFQAIQFQIADLAADLEAARLLMWQAADRRGRGEEAGVFAAMAKLQASEAAHRAADRAMQIQASAGYRRGSTIERLLRDIRAAEIYQGTSEVQRMIIAEGVLAERS